jgi:hypothetical protein
MDCGTDPRLMVPIRYRGAFQFVHDVMFFCGTHRLRSTMTSRKFIGKSQAVCAPSCKVAKQMDTQATDASSDEVNA